jgi:hypothetical protein
MNDGKVTTGSHPAPIGDDQTGGDHAPAAPAFRLEVPGPQPHRDRGVDHAGERTGRSQEREVLAAPRLVSSRKTNDAGDQLPPCRQRLRRLGWLAALAGPF